MYNIMLTLEQMEEAFLGLPCEEERPIMRQAR